jgi:amidophosphoribosyltransferase
LSNIFRYTKNTMSDPTSLREKCGVFGVYGTDLHAARMTYFGLYALQHRGQEGSGIVSSDGKKLHSHRGPGMVAQVYNEDAMQKLVGPLAIGHNRYSTSGGVSDEHIQPFMYDNTFLAIAHNGNLPSTTALEKFLKSKGVPTKDKNDSYLMGEAIAYYLKEGKSLKEAISLSYPLFTGAFSLLVLTKDSIAALRDPYGIRPLSIGTFENNYIFSSETCALDTVQATFLREVQPGEMVLIDSHGLQSVQLAPGDQKLDIFEFIYFSRPDSTLMGRNVNAVRYNLGVELAKEARLDVDLVIPVPDSAIPASLGYSRQTGLPYYPALIKNRYIGRTFIQPEQHLREYAVQMKLNPITSIIKGKRVAVVDDSIVRGTTSKKIIEMLYRAGAKEVHFLVSSPPYLYPDFYGIDTPKQEKLIAFNKTNEEIRELLGCTSLHYLSYSGVIRATKLPENKLCTACFTGIYPLDLRERTKEVRKTEKDAANTHS